MLGKGYVHLYTGNGKGKTTASRGLVFRAAGAGLDSIIIQFMKGQPYSELEAVKFFQGKILIEQYGDQEFCQVEKENFERHLEQAKKGFRRAKEALLGERQVIILDEVITAFSFHLLKEEEILELISKKPVGKELILTGRGATSKIIQKCDLVTEMKEVKHYFQQGLIARKGIEN